MTKANLIERLVERGIARSTAMQVIDEAIDIMSDTLASGQTITLRGLGTFKVRSVARKIARDISKGTTLVIPERKTVKLILSEKIKKALIYSATD